MKKNILVIIFALIVLGASAYLLVAESRRSAVPEVAGPQTNAGTSTAPYMEGPKSPPPADGEVAVESPKTIETGINEGASALGVTITPLEVLEDSRCPADVQCVWAGRVRVRATLETASGKNEQIIISNTPVMTDAKKITLVRIEPEARANTEEQPSAYRFYFEIKEQGS